MASWKLATRLARWRSPLSSWRLGEAQGKIQHCSIRARSYADDLSSLLDQNVQRTRRTEGVPAAPQPRPADDVKSLLDQRPPPQNVIEQAEDVEQEIVMLPEFESDEALVQHVAGILKESDWTGLFRKLAPLGHQVKAHHVPEILKRAQNSDVAFVFFKWIRARRKLELDPAVLRLMFVVLSTGDKVDKPDEMQWLLEEMHKKGVKLENSMFVTVMETFASMKRVPDAKRLFWKMESLECRPKTPTYNCILRILSDAGLNLEFDMIYSKMKLWAREMDSTTYQIVISKMCRVGKVDDAYKLLEEMKQKKFTPSSDVYASLVRSASSAGKEELAFEIIKQMDKPGEDVLNPVVFNLVQGGKLSTALTEYKKMLEAGVKAHNSTCVAILSELVTTEKTTQAFTLFNEMIKAGYITPADVLPVVNSSYKKCKIEIVWNFLKELSGKGCPFDTDTIHSLVEGLVLRRRIDIARRLFRSVMDAGKKPAAPTYNLFIKNLSTVDSTKQIFDLMKHNNCTPDVETYNGMIQSLTKGGVYSEAFELFTEMMDKGYTANAITYKLVVELLGKDPTLGVDTIVETLKKLQERGGFDLAARYLDKLSNEKLLPPKQAPKDGKVLVKILQKDGKRFDDIYM